MIEFGKIEIGQTFECELEFEWVRVPECGEGNAVDGSGTWDFFAYDEKVKLISNCIGCKFYEDGYNKGCGQVFIDLRDEKQGVYLGEDPKTYSCCKWRKKK